MPMRAVTETLKEQPTSGTPPSSRGLHVAAAADGQMVNDAFALDTRVVGALPRSACEQRLFTALALHRRYGASRPSQAVNSVSQSSRSCGCRRAAVRAPARALRHCRAGAGSWFAAAQRRAARGLVPDEG